MGHSHASAAAVHRGCLAAVLALSLTILVVEVIRAAVANSLALLADASHVLTDVGRFDERSHA
jgi:cobalt-zinc-cadmium efflux system protein